MMERYFKKDNRNAEVFFTESAAESTSQVSVLRMADRDIDSSVDRVNFTYDLDKYLAAHPAKPVVLDFAGAKEKKFDIGTSIANAVLKNRSQLAVAGVDAQALGKGDCLAESMIPFTPTVAEAKKELGVAEGAKPDSTGDFWDVQEKHAAHQL